MNRRFFLVAGALSLIAARRSARTSNVFQPYEGSSASRLPPVRAATLPASWRYFDLTLSLESKSARKLWFPLPLHQDTPTQPWQRVEQLSWESNAHILLQRQPDVGMEMLVCDWGAARAKPSPYLRLNASLIAADRRLDISRRTFAPDREDILRQNLTATALLPVNDLAKELAKDIVGRVVDPLAKAHAIYDWVVEKSVFDAGLPDGDGHGDIQQQIESQKYGGGAADISGLFVMLARAIGIPARRVFGFFAAPSSLSPVLGFSGEGELSSLLHCRAEFYSPGYHWIPVDPAGVCRAIALDHGITDSASNTLKRVLFGFWEANWLTLNHAESETLGNLPRFLPKSEYTCRVVSRETRNEDAFEEASAG